VFPPVWVQDRDVDFKFRMLRTPSLTRTKTGKLLQPHMRTNQLLDYIEDFDDKILSSTLNRAYVNTLYLLISNSRLSNLILQLIKIVISGNKNIICIGGTRTPWPTKTFPNLAVLFCFMLEHRNQLLELHLSPSPYRC
jgi:hypothetical protein